MMPPTATSGGSSISSGSFPDPDQLATPMNNLSLQNA
jgi:hypothetical protein